jgi:hypothetical protein
MQPKVTKGSTIVAVICHVFALKYAHVHKPIEDFTRQFNYVENKSHCVLIEELITFMF